MSEPIIPGQERSGVLKPRSHFNNWISAIGGVVAIGALFSFALLVWMDFTQGDKNPYLGIFTYIVAPGFLIGGLCAIFFGAWAQRRWAVKHAATMPDKSTYFYPKLLTGLVMNPVDDAAETVGAEKIGKA